MDFKIIKASMKDSKFLYKTRVSKEAKRNSLNQRYFDYDTHLIWFKKNILSTKHRFFVIKIAQIKIGYIRLKKIAKNQSFISIVVNEENKNSGIGCNALGMVEKKYPKEIFLAEVLKSNNKSINFFKKNLYRIYKKKKYSFIMKKNLSNQKKYLDTINKIEIIRKKNNTNWMDILKVAFTHSPEESAKIMSRIFDQDKRISKLSKNLSKK